MNQDQINSTVRSLLKIAGAAFVAHGMTTGASIVNTESIAGGIAALAGLLWSHFYHGDTTSPKA